MRNRYFLAALALAFAAVAGLDALADSQAGPELSLTDSESAVEIPGAR